MLQSLSSEEGSAELERLRAAVEGSGDLIYTWDLATDRIDWIGRPGRLFGGNAAAVPLSGDRFNSRINAEDLPCRMQALSEHLAGSTGYDCEYRIRSSTGDFHWVHDRGAVELSATGTPVRLSGTLRLITQRKLNEARLERLANYDELTGHYNKLRLREALDHALAHSHRYGSPGAFLAVGIDQLDRINTAYGSEAGDAVLVELARRLDHCLRATDVIGRLGSDRFGVALSFCDAEEAVAIAERIIQAVRDGPIEADGQGIHATVSVGIVEFPEQSKTSFDLIVKAENALLRAKSEGRDCVHVYRLSEEQQRSQRANLEIGERVTLAMKEGRLAFAYQPIVDAADHQVRYHECLLRMIDLDGTVVPAGEFVPVVERLGLMRALDRRVLDMVMRDLERHPDVVLAFNISGVTAADRGWLRALMARLKDREDLGRRLVVEITETAALHDIDDTARFVSVVRDLGCRVALDDFGAGYTTFRHLKALTVDVVKIDSSFVRDLAGSGENQLFIRNLLGLAHAFNLTTVAEGVETAEDAAVLTAEGIDMLQGYYFGQPEMEPVWRTAGAEELLTAADFPALRTERRGAR